MNDPFSLPPGPMPGFLSKAIHQLPLTESDFAVTEATERGDFEKSLAILNPWAPKVEGDGRLTYTDEDSAERELRDALSPVTKLFAGNATTAAPTSEPRFRFSKQPTPAPEEGWDSQLTKTIRNDEVSTLVAKSREEQLRAFVKRSIGDDIFPTAEDLAKYVERNDPEEAAEIRAIGKSL